MKHEKDKYGRGSAAANGEGFVDLAPGDTFDGLEQQLRARIAEVYANAALGISGREENRCRNNIMRSINPDDAQMLRRRH